MGGIFLAPAKWFPVERDWWPWSKPGYITITRGQRNNHWSSGRGAYSGPKNSERINLLENFSPWFFGIKMASSLLINFKRAKLSTRSITHIVWCNWRTFEGKRPREVKQGSLVLIRQHFGSTVTYNPEESVLPRLPVSPNLFSWSGPDGLPPVPWTEETTERSSFFLERGDYCCRGDMVGRTIFWFFFEWLAKLEQWAKKCIELRGDYVEKIPSLFTVTCFLLVGLWTYQHPNLFVNKSGVRAYLKKRADYRLSTIQVLCTM